MKRPRLGIWLIGARGGVASTVWVGIEAIRRKLVGTSGLVSELPDFAGLPLPDWDQFVGGGHEIRDLSLVEEAMRLATVSRSIDPAIIEECSETLSEIDSRIRPGVLCRCGSTIDQLASSNIPRDTSPKAAICRIQNDLAEFVQSHDIEHLIVMNVASTEPAVDRTSIPSSWSKLEPLLDRPDECVLPASSLYAIAALESGHSYINFTPSLGSSAGAIDELARLRGTQHMGCDGKTGETLMKSVLAPMFRQRNLPVMSWVGHNIFGNLDGKVLDDPTNKASKMTSKDRLLGEILGYRPQTLVSIEYIESLGDWKTAWDHIHFQGFLGTPMTLQFVWQGSDSLLAAPLVMDLIRFTHLARQRGEIGELHFLASFFKSPSGVDEHDFTRQFQMLQAWATEADDTKNPRSDRD